MLDPALNASTVWGQPPALSSPPRDVPDLAPDLAPTVRLGCHSANARVRLTSGAAPWSPG